MKSTTKRAFVVFLLVAFFSAGLVYLAINLGTNAEKWATLRANTHLVNDGSFIGAGNILDRNGVVLAETVDGERVYNNSEDPSETLTDYVEELDDDDLFEIMKLFGKERLANRFNLIIKFI